MANKTVEVSEKGNTKQPKIMTMPLPDILEELENYIRRVEEAVKVAQNAARESREAAAQARESGEQAADAAKKAAEAAVARVRQDALNANDATSTRVTMLESELNKLKEKVSLEAIALDQAFLAAKNIHVENSPFIEK